MRANVPAGCQAEQPLFEGSAPRQVSPVITPTTDHSYSNCIVFMKEAGRPRSSHLCQEAPVPWEELPDRSILLNCPEMAMPNNRVVTTSSNLLTFIPLNILGQLKKPANIYFVVLSILQMIGPISNSGGRPLVLLPLSCVIATVLIKDAVEELNRYRKDQQENGRPVEILTERGFEVVPCEAIRVGTVVRVSKDDMVPCDMVLLQTSDDKGRSYIETANLDGEMHLKVKKLPHNQLNSVRNLHQKRYQVKYERPNPFMHSFHGNIAIEGETFPLNLSQLLLKGSTLKNVLWACGVCVYSGPQTKLSLNSVKFSSKRSQLDKDVNLTICMIFGLQFLLSFAGAVINLLLQRLKPQEIAMVDVLPFWIMAGVWWLIMSYFVPISLIVTLEMVKFIQGKLLMSDPRMYSPATDSYPVMNNSTVNENLGRIKYVFSDKTGTLTSNVMNFKRICLNGHVFGLQGQSRKDYSPLYQRLNITNVDFHDSRLLESSNRYAECFKMLALCNDVVVENDKDGRVSYSSSSPDEIAIVNFAKLCGYELIGEQSDRVVVYSRQQNRTHRYKLLAGLEFSSNRKRMSVLIQDEKGEIKLLTKGADNLVRKLLKPHSPYLDTTERCIDEFSNEGLRTLMLASRSVHQSEYQQWKKVHHEAATSLNNRQELLQRSYELIEKQLELIGCTAVEDKLQEDVPRTIQLLRECDIVFYILTGDKRETAVNIGRSCGMITPKTTVVSPPDGTCQETQQWLREHAPLPANSVLVLNASLDLPKVPLHSTICYRCTPTQKERVVRSVKDQTEDLTLSIGDGSNDVNMIVTSDVGIGIKGKEGNEVARVSDFVLGQFSLLGPLIVYYGREWNRRNSKLVNYNFFKNIYHVIALFAYGVVSFFSGSILFEVVMYQFYNSFFTSGAILCWAVTDDEYTFQESIASPCYYRKGQNGEYFNKWTYWKNIFVGAYHGCVSLLFVALFTEQGVISQDGRVSYKSEMGMVLFANMVIIVNLKVVLMSHGVSLGLILSILIEAVLYFLTYLVYMMFFRTQIYECFYTQLSTPSIYCTHAFLCGLLLIFDLIGKKFDEFQKREWFKQGYQSLK